MRYKKLFVLTAAIITGLTTFAQTQLTVQANKPITNVPPNMWGIFFEDINFAADGGLYAELVKNRSFEFYNPLMGWKEMRPQATTGKLLIINSGNKNPANPRFASIAVSNNDTGYGIANECFRGMGIEKGKGYVF